MKKVVWIDIGTHFGQEHSSIFGSSYSFYGHVIRRFLGAKVFKRGKFVNFKGLRNIIYARNKIRQRSEEFYTVFVEANPKIIINNNTYLNADLVFNLALLENNQTPLSLTKLYLGNGDELSQGSSVFLEKNNVNKMSYVTTIGVSASVFFHQLKLHIEEIYDDYQILVRLNCEGAEDDVIYSAHDCFDSKVKMVCGSLKDVEGVKGLSAYKKLKRYMSDNELPFVYFSSAIDTWPKAHNAIINLLDK